jgi:TonB-dependent SusC/RagA subfamily outer membrane receptor
LDWSSGATGSNPQSIEYHWYTHPGLQSKANLIAYQDLGTGLGSVTHEQLTFALAHMADEHNDFCNYSDVFSLVKGKFPGVTVKTNSLGTDGIFVRGDKSMYGDNEAIYVVDWVRIGDVSFVNPCEMATIDVLKDGGAALYGSDAANGVVVIETKGHRSIQ